MSWLKHSARFDCFFTEFVDRIRRRTSSIAKSSAVGSAFPVLALASVSITLTLTAYQLVQWLVKFEFNGSVRGKRGTCHVTSYLLSTTGLVFDYFITAKLSASMIVKLIHSTSPVTGFKSEECIDVPVLLIAFLKIGSLEPGAALAGCVGMSNPATINTTAIQWPHLVLKFESLYYVPLVPKCIYIYIFAVLLAASSTLGVIL